MLRQEVNSALLKAIPTAFIRNGQFDRRAFYTALVQNNTLREDATRTIEETLTRVGRRDLRAVADLRNAGLQAGTDKGIGSTSFEFDRITPVGPAGQGMSIMGSLGFRDLVTFERTAVPIPVTGSQFMLDARHQAAGRGFGESVDTTNIEEHTRAVIEKLEDTLVNGSDVNQGSNTLPGYTNFSSRETLSFTDVTWSSTASNANIVTDVLAMKQALEDNGFTGPYVLYIPSGYSSVMGEDYSAQYSQTVRQRLLSIDGISDIRVLPSLPASNVLLVQLTSSVVQMPVGQDITVATNSLMGGLAMEWYVFAVISFALKAAYCRAPLSDGVVPVLTTSSGIAHLS